MSAGRIVGAMVLLAGLAACGPQADELPEPVGRVPPMPHDTLPATAPVAAAIEEATESRPSPGPGKLFETPPEYPSRTPSGRPSGSVWVGELHLGSDGCVTRVQVIRPITWNPPWPEWERVLPESFMRRCYEPTLLEGEPVPVIMTVSVNIHWN